MDYDKFVLFFRKYIEPFAALGVLIILFLLYMQLSTGNELREEISQNCGWGDEEYSCFCEKSKAMEIQRQMYNFDISVEEVLYVQMDR